ncbi:MAG: YihA family ribosome biogenesis GTP-binding protein [Myxococcales bacterium]|nr:YihA family ribosome biogenesis GTP-binding protein [Myxococcales bacterium]
MPENPHVHRVHFVKSAVRVDEFPDLGEMPEVAVAGRSNVGKSSLINGLVNRRQLARVSNTPGRTQLLNFFVVNDHFALCDLPGYGFAQVPGALRASWGPMVERYLTHRGTLRALLLLLDIRREPGEWETSLVHWCSYHGQALVPVVTKIDKLGKAKRTLAMQQIAGTLGLAPRQLIGWSALSGEGLEPLWRRVVRLVGPPPGATGEAPPEEPAP